MKKYGGRQLKTGKWKEKIRGQKKKIKEKGKKWTRCATGRLFAVFMIRYLVL